MIRVFSRNKIFYGWFVVVGSIFVMFGISGGNFSFGVFLKPMTQEFEWSRASLSLAFGIAFMLSGLFRPLAGYLADRYSPKAAVIAGVVVMGGVLLLLPLIQNLAHLYLLFSVMAIGITLGMGPILTKIISGWFYERRGFTLGLLNGAGSLGGMVLVPGASLFLWLADWREAYWFLGGVLLAIVLPAGYLLIRNRPEEMDLRPMGEPAGDQAKGLAESGWPTRLFGRDATFREAVRTPLFMKLTFGYFV